MRINQPELGRVDSEPIFRSEVDSEAISGIRVLVINTICGHSKAFIAWLSLSLLHMAVMPGQKLSQGQPTTEFL